MTPEKRRQMIADLDNQIAKDKKLSDIRREKGAFSKKQRIENEENFDRDIRKISHFFNKMSNGLTEEERVAGRCPVGVDLKVWMNTHFVNYHTEN